MIYFSLIIAYIRLQMLSKVIKRNLKISSIIQCLNCREALVLLNNKDSQIDRQQLHQNRTLYPSMGIYRTAHSFHTSRRKQDKIAIFENDLGQVTEGLKKELSFEQKIKSNVTEQLKDIKSKLYGEEEKSFELQRKIQQVASAIMKMKELEKDQVKENIKNYAVEISLIIQKAITQYNEKLAFQVYLSAINQLKSFAIGLYDTQLYSQFFLLCNQIVQLSLGFCRGQIQKISATAFEVYSKTCTQINTIQENSYTQKHHNLELTSKRITSRDLSTLISNFSILPTQHKDLVLQLLLLRSKHLSPTVITIFMADCIIIKQNLSRDFLQKFYVSVSNLQFLNSYRYIYLSFIGTFSEKCKYEPLYNPNERYRKFIPFGVNLTLSQIELFTKLVTKEIQIAFKTQTQYWAYQISRLYLILMTQCSDKKISLQKFIPIYNQISRLQPIGFWMVRHLDRGYYLFKVTNNNKKEVKLFVRNLMKNFQPDYIYSLQEVSIKQLGPELISLVLYLSQKIIINEPQFLFEIQNIFNQTCKHSREIVYDAVQTLFNELKINVDGISIVLDSDRKSQNLEDSQRALKVKQFFKLLSILHQNNNIHIDQFIDYNTECFNQVMSSKTTLFEDPNLYQFLYHVASFVSLYSDSEIQGKLKASKIFHRFCLPYIQNALQDKSVYTIKPSRIYQIQILLIASLSQVASSPQVRKLLVSFINERFIYTVKSVIKSDIFQIFSLFDFLQDINPQIYGYLLANLSSFVVYQQKNKKFYVKQGPNRRYQKKFVEIIHKMAKNFETLRLIENKDRLNTISLIFTLFWNRLSNVQIAQLIIIIGEPSYLSSKLYFHLTYVKFFKQDLEGLGKYRNILQNFKMVNKSLMGVLDNISSTEVEQKYLQSQLTDLKSQSEIKLLFQHLQTYEEALQNKNFTNQHLIPPPITTSGRIKMIYICLKILAKIRKHRNYDLLQIIKDEQALSKVSNKIPPPIDFRQEIQYIVENNLINRQKNNEFKMRLDLSQSHYEVIQCWNKYGQQNIVHLQEYNNFIDSGLGKSSFFEKVILSFTGNYGLVTILMKKQPIFSDLCLELDNKDIPYTVKGGMISIGSGKGSLEGSLLVFASSSQYSKLNLILCYIMEQTGSKVFHLFNIDQKQMKIEMIGQFLQKYYKQIVTKEGINQKKSEQIGYFESFQKGVE